MSKQKDMYDLISKNNLSITQRKKLYGLLRENSADMPDCTFQNAYILYTHDPKSDHKYLQLEDIVYNGLHLRFDRKTLKSFVMHMKKRIGDTNYMKRLFRFVNYITGTQNDAGSLNELLSEDFSDNQTIKKTIIRFKREGKIQEYVERLNKYLSIEPMDEEAWLQLAQVYTERGHYMKAAFCYEQLISIKPSNDLYVLKLSELYLTLNNKINTEQAIKYLSYLITKRPDNIRALWILYRATSGNQQYSQLRQTCSSVIHNIYSRKNSSIKFHQAL